jgi:hypothetical protein
MNRRARIIAIGASAALAAGLAVPAAGLGVPTPRAEPVPLAKNAYRVAGYAVSPSGKKPRSLVPTNRAGKLPSRVMNISVVPPGATVYGFVGVAARATGAGQRYSGYGSYPLPAPVGLTASKMGILGGNNENADCSGSYERPTAPPGILCLYPGKPEGYYSGPEADIINVRKGGEGNWDAEVYPISFGGDRYGFRLDAASAAAGEIRFAATWAYTAPDGKPVE